MGAAFDRALRDAIAAEVEGIPGRDLARAADTLSRRYRDTVGGPGGHRLPEIERVAYATTRLPATAAALDAVLGALAPDAAPATLLDLGAGPATALWPAVARWPGLTRVTLLDRDPDMLRLGVRLWRRAHPEGSAGPDVVTRSGDLAAADVEAADVVVASYAMGELDPPAAERALDRALDLATCALVVVEPGTPAGFARIRLLRDRAIAAGAAVVAPCPHNRACPMAGSDWCHFAVRLDRSRAHRHVKQALLGWEDEKFAYVVLAPSSTPARGRAAGRVIRRPRKGTGHVGLTLCAVDGLQEVTITRRDPAYRDARDVSWGDPWPGAPTP